MYSDSSFYNLRGFLTSAERILINDLEKNLYYLNKFLRWLHFQKMESGFLIEVDFRITYFNQAVVAAVAVIVQLEYCTKNAAVKSAKWDFP